MHASERRLSQLSRYLLHHSLRFARDVRGGIMITFALVFPVMLLGIGSAIDFGQLYSKRTTLQAAADAGALTGASELQLANSEKSNAEAAAKTSVLANLKDMPGTIGISVNVSNNPTSVTVDLTQEPGTYFMDTLLGNPDSVIKARATARVAGSMPICMLILDEKSRGAIAVNQGARITGNDCAVYSNSTSSSGIAARPGSLLVSALTCSAGGVSGDPDSFKPGPLTDCPPIDDPLASRPPPPVGPCTETDLIIQSGMHTLNPGTYCGGLRILAMADVTLNPGVYVIKDGQMIIGGSARLTGENVGFYLTGKTTTFNMFPDTTIELSAPKDGPMVGILFFEDRNRPTTGKHVIRSNNARTIIGTIYLSRAELMVDAVKPVFDKSAYTVIIARKLNMFSGPNLILNTDYDGSDIPIPSEVAAMPSPSDHIVLIK